MPQTDSQTTVESKKRKQVLVPPEKKEAKEDQFITPKGNDIMIEFDGFYGMYKVSFGKGPVPKSLSGKYTERERAEKAVKSYLENEYKY